MNRDLPIWIMEPEQTEVRHSAAAKLSDPKASHISEAATVDELKQQLRKIRHDARDNINSLVEALKVNLGEKYPGVEVKWAADNLDAVTYVSEISDGSNTISINNSSVITQELKPGLIHKGFRVINSYLDEFEVKKREVRDYWDLPRLFDRNLKGNFDISIKWAGLPQGETRQYLAVLGINAISAEDCTVFFLEHFSNIEKDLKQASKVVLVVGLDKIVKTRQEAAFQTQCMGILGMESVILGIEPKPGGIGAIEEMSLPPGGGGRELHLVILDNGRARLLEGKFQDLFLCIGCRACNKHCPIRHSFTQVDYIWTPRNYLNEFLDGTGRSVDVCLHCEACHMECPVDIDLPYLMWQAKMDYIAQHGRSFRHRILGRPELLAKLGTSVAPIANWMMGRKLVRVPMEATTGIDRRTGLPKFHFQTFRSWFEKYGRRVNRS